MTDPVSSELLARYLGAEASAAERAAVEAWAAASSANRRELEQLRAVWRPAGSPERWDVDRAWNRVAARLDEVPAPALRFKPRSPVLAIAASLLLLAGAAWLWTLSRPATAEQRYVTAAGETRTIELPDGTRIELASRSTLRVDPDFGRTTRRVDLEGEAWFAVEHDAARPFLVHAAGTITEDLGTEFLVRELDRGAGVEVALQSGSASLRREGVAAAEAVVLEPNDVATLAPGEARATVRRLDALDPLLAWREGRLEFSDAPASQVADALARWYPVVFVIDPPAGARRFTGTLRLAALDDALEVLVAALGARIERRADTVFIR